MKARGVRLALSLGLSLWLSCVGAEPVSSARTATLREAIDDLSIAALNRGYQLVKVQPVDSALVKRGFEDPHVRILFVGNAGQMQRASELDPVLLSLLPLRLILKQHGEVVEVSSDDLAPWIERAANADARALVETWQSDLRAMLEEYARKR